MEVLIKSCKEAYAKGDLDMAVKYWCEIYEFFEKKMEGLEDKTPVFVEQAVVMRNFTNEEVYGITDYYKKLKGF